MSVVSHILSPGHYAVPVPCVITPRLSFTCVPGPHPDVIGPPPFLLLSVLPPACGVLHPRPGPGPCTSPIHPASSCLQQRWGVLGCGSGHSPHASRSHHPITPIPGAPHFQPMSSCSTYVIQSHVSTHAK
jgi:hypothetical protein